MLDDVARRREIDKLAKDFDPSSIRSIIESLPAVGVAAAEALEMVRFGWPVNALIAATESEDFRVRLFAGDALGCRGLAGDHEICEALGYCLRNSADEGVRCIAAEALGKLGVDIPAWALDLLRDLAGNETNPRVRDICALSCIAVMKDYVSGEAVMKRLAGILKIIQETPGFDPSTELLSWANTILGELIDRANEKCR